MNRVLVIIVTYNAMNWIDRCLYRLTGLPVLIVDNGSSDGTVDYILENYPDVELIVSKENIGFGAANNSQMHIHIGTPFRSFFKQKTEDALEPI